MDNDLAVLNQKIDYLTELFEAQNRKQRSFDELKDDMLPIANQIVRLAIEELAEIGSDFELEDLLFLLKRILRDTHLLTTSLERLEAISGLADEMQLLSKQIFNQAVAQLERLEKDGYIDFARNGLYVTGELVKVVKPEDMRALGDNMGDILAIARKINQPVFLQKVSQGVDALVIPDDGKVSFWDLARTLFDLQVRKGIVRMLKAVKGFA